MCVPTGICKLAYFCFIIDQPGHSMALFGCMMSQAHYYRRMCALRRDDIVREGNFILSNIGSDSSSAGEYPL